MRDWMRLLVFAAVVAIITVAIAPPEPRAAGAAEQTAGAAAAGSVAGVYVGRIVAGAPGTLPETGTIVIRPDGDNLVVSAGPDAATQYTATKVVRTAEGVTFEVAIEAESPLLFQFDVKIQGSEMNGTIARVQGDAVSRGRLTFTRQ